MNSFDVATVKATYDSPESDVHDPQRAIPWHDRLIRSFVWANLILFAGCLGTSTPTGTVVGKVTYNGQPVPKGCLVTFESDRGFVSQGVVDESGNYKLLMEGKPEIPTSKYNIAVVFPGIVGPEMTDEDERKFMAGDPATVAKFAQKQKKSPIPEKYEDKIKSGLTFEIKEGENTYDIDLK